MADISDLENNKVAERLASDKDFWWVILGMGGVGNGNKPKITVQAEGGGSLETMLSLLADDQLQFGCFKVLGVDNKGAVTSVRTKYVCFQWVGPRVSKLATAKAIPTKSAVFSYFQGHTLSLEVYDRATINAVDIEARLRACGGAHQPSDMQFPGGGHDTKNVAGLSAAPVEAAPAAAAPVSSSSVSSTGSSTSPTSASGASGSSAPVAAASSAFPKAVAAAPAVSAAKVARAQEEATAAIKAAGAAAAKLGDLITAAKDSEGGSGVPVADLEGFVASQLGTVSTKLVALTALLDALKA